MGASQSHPEVSDRAFAPAGDEARAPSNAAIPSQATQATPVVFTVAQTASQAHAAQETTLAVFSGHVAQDTTQILYPVNLRQTMNRRDLQAIIRRQTGDQPWPFTQVQVQGPQLIPRQTMNRRDLQAIIRRQTGGQPYPSTQVQGSRLIPRPTMNLRDLQATRRRQTSTQVRDPRPTPRPTMNLRDARAIRRRQTMGQPWPFTRARMQQTPSPETPLIVVGETTSASQNAMDEFVTRREMEDSMDRLLEELQRRT